MNTLFAVRTPPQFDGPFSQCLARAHPADPRDFERRWNRGQMRTWAGHWRQSRATAALLGRPVQEVAQTALNLALIYRNAAARV